MKDPSPEEARRLARGPLGREMQNTVLRYAVPIYWIDVKKRGGTLDEIRSGTTFFLDCGVGIFGVTAGHVYDAFVRARTTGARCQIGASRSPLDLSERLIDRGRDVDIATYRVSAAEVVASGAVPLTGWQSSWPPTPPEINRGVVYGGYPGVGRHVVAPMHIEFNALTGSGIASSVSDRDVSSVVERDVVEPTMGLELPSPGFNLAGMSGGPMLTIVQGAAIMGWRLAGVIYQCSRELGEIVVAARADFIGADGRIVG